MDRELNGNTNIGLGIVGCRKNCTCSECTIEKLIRRINELLVRNTQLEREHLACHKYAGCTPDNCNASGFECPVASAGSELTPKEQP